MSENFIRSYRMSAGVAGRSGFAIGTPTGISPHIAFSVEKSAAESANTAKIQVWNLSPSSLSVLDTKDCVIELKAGYGNNMALILVGNVVSAVTQLDGADRLTEIEVVDGRVAIRDTYLSLSYDGQVNAKVVFDNVIAEMGVSVVYSEGSSTAFVEFPNGFSFIGSAGNALTKLCNACGLVWSMQNQVLQVRQPNEPISARGYLLSSDTGLLEVPKRITLAAESAEGSATETSGKKDEKNVKIGYEVRFFMNAAIGVNDYVQLESSVTRGYFRVDKLTIDGDNLEGEWTCTAQLYEVKGA
ncbi:hypothetical protein [Lacrimispora sp.]|uniref:hypothetical protein n=1 Tax=Lacrimispora sp. TaxID=2719234 RepID=UPI0028AFF7D6|nr:hypothetical protein [Lacrimispora sp.]